LNLKSRNAVEVKKSAVIKSANAGSPKSDFSRVTDRADKFAFNAKNKVRPVFKEPGGYTDDEGVSFNPTRGPTDLGLPETRNDRLNDSETKHKG
jgi:hypothetical protein